MIPRRNQPIQTLQLIIPQQLIILKHRRRRVRILRYLPLPLPHVIRVQFIPNLINRTVAESRLLPWVRLGL